MPTGVRDVEIVAHWPSRSNTVLVAIPATLWSYLKDDPAYCFVDFAFGDIQLIGKSAASQGLAMRLPSAAGGVENVRPGSSSQK
jgi:hypothetical protein